MRIKRRLHGITMALGVFQAANPGWASEPLLTGFVAAGVATTADYEGSDAYQPVPFLTAHLRAGKASVEFEGLTARWHLKPPTWFEAGLTVNYRTGRDDAIDSERVGALAPVDGSIEAGAFLRLEFDDRWQARDSLAVQIEPLWDTGSAHNGSLTNLSASYAFFPVDRLRLGLGIQVTYADRHYMATYFDVTADNIVTSDLPMYESSSGFKDAGLHANLSHFFNEHWGVLGRLAYNHLIGDAADSPIVAQAGNPNQWFAGLALTRQFHGR